MAARTNPTVDDLRKPPPGFPPAAGDTIPTFQAKDFKYVFTSFNGQPTVAERHTASIAASDGVIIKSCMEIEGPYVKFLSSLWKKPLLLAGPVVPEPPAGELDRRWAEWLARLDDDSVVLVTFGSEVVLSSAAAQELLLGLEAAGFPFLAVLNTAKGADVAAELAKMVPAGMLERIGDRGVVHSGWVPQQHLLRHRAVGCYFTHSGVSSLVEALVGGCRIVALPHKGDQFLNAALYAGELGVGVMVERRDEDGWYGREEVRSAVVRVMEDPPEVAAARRRWREFFMDEAAQRRFTSEFASELKELVAAAKQN